MRFSKHHHQAVLFCASAMFFFLLVILLRPSKAGANDESIRFGGIFCLTGEVAQGCNAIREGAEVAAEMINRQGGVLGRKIVLDIQDSGFRPRTAHTLAQKFSSDPSVLAVLITGVIETKPAGPVLERAHLPSITLWDSTPEIDDIGHYAFGIGPWLPSTYETSASFAINSLHAKTAAVLSSNMEWSQLVAKGFAQHFEKLGGKILSANASSPDEGDYRAVLLRAMSDKPDVIYAPITAHLSAFFRQAKLLNYSGSIITSDNLTEGEMAQDPTIYEGVYQSQVSDPDTIESRRLSTLYVEKYKKPASMLVFYAWGYDGVRLLAQAASSSNLTRESIAEELYKLRAFPGANGPIQFDDGGSWRMPVHVYRVQGAKFIGVN